MCLGPSSSTEHEIMKLTNSYIILLAAKVAVHAGEYGFSYELPIPLLTTTLAVENPKDQETAAPRRIDSWMCAGSDKQKLLLRVSSASSRDCTYDKWCCFEHYISLAEATHTPHDLRSFDCSNHAACGKDELSSQRPIETVFSPGSSNPTRIGCATGGRFSSLSDWITAYEWTSPIANLQVRYPNSEKSTSRINPSDQADVMDYWSPGPFRTYEEKIHYEVEVDELFAKKHYPSIEEVVGGNLIRGC
ncbi:hypothetical protein BDV97DRAFT_372318 [Delphinella strobiligena]|nr:hypothetical protein BDV97DRAFT_372318 [Delphinella strobiligena]